MAARSNAAVQPGELELVMTRLFDAPRALVWKAWSERDHRDRCMGPQGLNGSIVKMDLRSGGAYRFHLRSADGADLWQQGVYREVVEPERLGCPHVLAGGGRKPPQ